MRLSIVLLFLSFGLIYANETYAQNTVISLNMADGRISDILENIENQTDYSFIYDSRVVDVNKKISVDFQQENLFDLLNQLFARTDVAYTVINDKIILNRERELEALKTQQEQRTVTGTVVDENGEPLPGVNVTLMGTTTGVITDMDGNYSINVPGNNAILQFSFIGYLSNEIVVGNQSIINITLKEDVQMLEEVVVVGYGTQAKKDITGSVTVVTAESLAESATVTFAQALQGKSSGVYVSTTGAPGSESIIRVRGIGSINGSDPLVIIDGVSGGSVSSVPSSNIETFQILKDASATAIYGAQGANGVIIITTKQGTKSGQARLSYDGYVGLSTLANKGYDLLGGNELMEFAAEGMINTYNYRGENPGTHSQFGGLVNVVYDNDGKISSANLTMPYSITPNGLSEQDIINQFGSIENWEAEYNRDISGRAYTRSAYYQILHDFGVAETNASEAQLEQARRGTDWLSLIKQNGLIQDHQINVIGGNDKGQYSMSFGYTGQEGVVKSSYYDRYSVRANLTLNLRKQITIGQNTSLSVTEYQGDRGMQDVGGIFTQTYTMNSWVPTYNIGGDFAGSTSLGAGRNYSSLAAVTRQIGDITRGMHISESIFAEIKPIEGLTLKSQVATTINYNWAVAFAEQSNYDSKEGSTYNEFTESGRWSMGWQWTNTATYTKKLDDHSFTFVLGSEALSQGYGRSISASRQNYTYPDDQNTWIINNGSSVNLDNAGIMGSRTSMFGYFARADYSHLDKYLLTINVRRDASSKFSEENRWGTFPSASLGWRISDEPFMDGTSGWLNNLLLRAGYGATGNSNIGAYNWAYQYSYQVPGELFGTTNMIYPMTGTDTDARTAYVVSYLGDRGARWETIKMLNVGTTANMFKNRLSVEFDWYIKNTSDMLVIANWTALAGESTKPNINIGSMKNTGFDINMGWNDKVGKLTYGITGNISQYRNEITKLGSPKIYTSTWLLENVAITTVGQPIGMFYGYNIIGIYQDVEDVLNYTDPTTGETILPYGITSYNQLITLDESGNRMYTNANEDPLTLAYVGRYKFEDVDEDGKINENDRTYIGNPHPDFTGGINLSLGYGNWDFSSYMYFSVGNDIMKMYSYFIDYGALDSNYSRNRKENSWSEDNPDGIYPLWCGTSNEAVETTSTVNTNYIEDGSYLRMQNITLGYNLPKSLLNKFGASQFRIYGQISNLFTLTNYSGLDPEVRSEYGDASRGIDYGAYGIPRQFIFGVNLTL